jgi:methionyl aminopeptidase
VVTAADGWTLHTADGGLSAQFEHTIMITKGQPVVLTAMPSPF